MAGLRENQGSEQIMTNKSSVRAVILCAAIIFSTAAFSAAKDARLLHSFRRPAKNHWIYVHLEGTPKEVGFQDGYWLSQEILAMKKVSEMELSHDTKKDWAFFRDAAEHMMWPHIEQEYRDELQGITDGVRARGVNLDLWDIVAMNGLLEWTYYTKQYDKEHGITQTSQLRVPDHCSAFVATGSYTKDGKPVIAHNAWTNYLDGERWIIVYDIAPAHGYHILMDGLPGFIASDDDFGINSAGLMICETTISGFSGYDPNGIPEFVRARKAMQYAASIDDYARIIEEGNNGGYANDWLIADRNTGEIASLELGLKNVTLDRTKDGFFVSSNFPINPKLAKEESDFDLSNPGLSPNSRHARWLELMAEYKGKIDLGAAEKFMGDHYDTYDKKIEPDERTLCGHIDLSARGYPGWMPPYGPGGATQNKATDSDMAARMEFAASAGHSCGISFKAAPFLAKHPEFDWQKPLLRDMPSGPWTTFAAAK
jgi:Phospholipase B